MFKEYDVVYSNEQINEKVPYNTKGVVVMILDTKIPVFEIEFVDADNQTLDITEVRGSQLQS
ncbi:DUF4926 domain-containing protein [Listeria welshimeri]|nr:DUF4926 domain-containing protein [Listeria welshimeri]MBC6179669.1 DUF4926 domain-containing protein [Listeria welshimeri]